MDYLVNHLLRSSADRYPEKEALVHGDQRLTYAEVAGQTVGLAHGLQRVGLQSGDRIGIFLRPSVPQVLSIFGISMAGGVFVPINDTLFPSQVAHIAQDCQMKGLITDSAKLASLLNVIKNVSSLEFVVLLEAEALPEAHIPTHIFEQLCELKPPPTWTDIGIEKDLAAIMYTSGSTGKPKGIMLSHANIVAGASIVSTYLEITTAERILAVLPFSFDAGLNQLTTAFQQGATLVLMTFIFAREIVQMILKERISALAGVPTLWSLLAQPNSSLHKHRFPDLRYITNTGGSMPQNVLTILRASLPTTKIFLMYGLTEAFRSTYLPPEELDRRPTSIGKAIPNTEILVVNDQGQLCQPGEMGELVHRGPTVSLGYWGQPELSERVFRPHPFLPSELGKTERVCYSGDLVKMDAEGFLYFVSRRDTQIKTAGFRISPTEVEEVLFQCGELQGAAVIGVPDEMLGQHIKAFVVPRKANAVEPAQLIAFCGERMPRYMVPKSVEILDELPKTSNKKIDYAALRRREGL
ncbi:MAG: acyl-CoA ligase (AMP-forming), exosortase A system-associated [Deltaproteobacteria bacterium]|nr:acyl-CoA ligase (AMP-forming), exosortase A system-associated [Deltaproteobacteria bacterium]